MSEKRFFYVKMVMVTAMLCIGGIARASVVTYTYDDLNRLAKADYGDGTYIGYVCDNVGNMTRKTFYANPLMVTLAGFEATVAEDGVLLTWKTLSETENAGFHILRSDTPDGEYERITGFIIPSRGGATEAAAYAYKDSDIIQGKTYYYKLEDIDYRNISTYSKAVSSGGETVCSEDALCDLIRILQINAGASLSLSADMREDVTGDGKAGLEDAIRLLRKIGGTGN